MTKAYVMRSNLVRTEINSTERLKPLNVYASDWEWFSQNGHVIGEVIDPTLA